MLHQILSSIFWNVVAGAVWAAMFWGVTRLWVRWRTARLEREYGLGGRYLTWYDDPQPDGSITRRVATAALQRHGHRLLGQTQELDTERIWELDLHRIGDRHILGTYRSTSPHDPSLGVVFLTVEGPGLFRGLWAGYDPITREVQSGRYRWRKEKPVQIGSLTSPQLSVAATLLAEAFGERYLSEDALRAYENAHHRAAWGAWDPSSRRLVGVALAEQADWPPDDPQGRLVRQHLPGLTTGTVGLLKAIAVEPAWQECGIGSRLARTALSWLDQHPWSHQVALAWRKPEGCPAGPLLERLGFRAIAVLPEFWRDDSLRRGYICPVCGSPCRCAAVLYHRRPAMPASLDAEPTAR
ncbi:MAG: GNAT family N-acetyltransferase [Firmicutes bacterium]|nr:GNAT family N-acetyltransferase [Bacillota bacterium]